MSAVDGPLTGRTALVTGAARGQGRSHALRLAREGASIAICDLCATPTTTSYPGATPADLDTTRQAVEALGARCVVEQVDVRDLHALSDFAARACEELGPATIVVANAGIAGGAPIEQMTEAAWREMIDIDLTGVWNTVRATVPIMLERHVPGSIVLVSSANGGLKAPPHLAHYSAAKHGVVGLARSLANELGRHGIRVNSVHPTAVDTDMIHNEFTYRLFRPDLENPGRDDVVELFSQFHSLPIPWVDVQDVSEAVAFLASDRSRYVTGIALPVDAGLSAR